MQPSTTFAKLHAASACVDRYKHLAKALGGITKYGRNKPITLLQILDANGLNDALWALCACDDSDKFARLLACDFAKHVLPIFEREYPDDKRPREAIAVARRYANGQATDNELAVARAAAWDAVGAAVGAAAWAAAWAAAGAAAWAAAWDAAGAAAGAAAWDAARAAEQKWQEQRLRAAIAKAEVPQ